MNGSGGNGSDAAASDGGDSDGVGAVTVEMRKE